MRKLFILLLLLPSILYAVEFTVDVSNANISFDETIELTFSLIGASEKKAPDFSILNRDFNILSQGKSSQIVISNGKYDKYQSWTMLVSPKITGSIEIPAIEIITNYGAVSSQKISIQVAESSVKTHKKYNEDVVLQASLNHHTAYVNQPLVYSLELYLKNNGSNLVIDNLDLDKCLVEKQNNIKEYTKLVNGQRVKFYKMDYIITPLHPGIVDIPSLAGQLDKIPDLFSHNFGTYRFSSQPVSFEARKTIDNLPPFSRLVVTEEYDNKNNILKDNESITRKITISGEDGLVDMLNVIEINDSTHYKVYSDKAKSETIITDDGKVRTTKTYLFTFVPLVSGNFVLPKITIPWFNISSKHKEYIELPEKNIENILNEHMEINTNSTLDADLANKLDNSKSLFDFKNPVFYVLILSVLVNAFVIGYLWYKKSNNTNIKNSKKNIDNSVNNIQNFNDLNSYIKKYSENNWNIDNANTIDNILSELGDKKYSFDLELADTLRNAINTSLYYKDTIALKSAIDYWQKFSKTVMKSTNNSKSNNANIIDKLNPT